jgi:hypothetical protein
MPAESDENHLNWLCDEARRITDKAREDGVSINDVARAFTYELGMIVTAQPEEHWEAAMEEIIDALRKICPHLREHQKEHPNATH